MKKLLAEGAEAKVYLENNQIIKERVPKTYRHETLDKQIRKRRNKAEAKILQISNDLNLNTPKLISSDKFTITLEYLDGERLSETLNNKLKEDQIKIISDLAIETKNLHKNRIIHGDLTTSNVILKDNKIYIIDFGLGKISEKVEDKSVDLHLIKEAMNAKHFENSEELWKAFKESYKDKEVLARLEVVEKRGRYKH